MDKLKQLESFVSVATKGSLTAGARAEGVAPAIMGRRLDALEERLGVKLMVRTTRRITLTHEGSAVLEDCHRLLGGAADAGGRRRQGRRPPPHPPPRRLRPPPRRAAGAAVPRAACRRDDFPQPERPGG